MKVRLTIVAILTSEINGKGRKIHSTAFLKEERDVVPEITEQAMIISVRRPAKRSPVITPCCEIFAIGKFGIGSPGMRNAFEINTIRIKTPKNRISLSRAPKGSFAAHIASIISDIGTR